MAHLGRLGDMVEKLNQILNFLVTNWDTILVVLAICSGILYLMRLGKKIGNWENRLMQFAESISALMQSHGRLVGELAKDVLGGRNIRRVMQPYEDHSIRGIQSIIESLGSNPMTPEELDKLISYMDRVAGETGPYLNQEEAQEAYDLAVKLTEEHPDRPQLQKVVDMFSYSLGYSSTGAPA